MWIDEYVAAWNDHDADAVTDFMTNDVVYADLALGEQFEGVDAVRAFVDGMEIGFSADYYFTLGHAVVTSEAYSFDYWDMATYLRQVGLMPAT